MEKKIFDEEIPRCSCGGLIKPDIVFFGEDVKFMDESIQLARLSDLFLIVGSSLTVYPASAIPSAAGRVVVVNKGAVAIPLEKVALFAEEELDDFFKEAAKYMRVKSNKVGDKRRHLRFPRSEHKT